MATILVVDDEAVFCELLKTLLKSHGHEVLTANDGRQALEVFKRHRPQMRLSRPGRRRAPPLECWKRTRSCWWITNRRPASISQGSCPNGAIGCTWPRMALPSWSWWAR